MKSYDFAILGAGATGFAAAIRANELGKKTVVINHGLPLGGTCVNVGCVPSKTLMHAAELLWRTKHHNIPGIHLQVGRFSFGNVIQDELNLVERLRHEKYEGVLKRLKHVQLKSGFAKFLDDTTIRVGDEKIQAKRFLIATGSTANGLPVPGLEEVGYITHLAALKLKKQPKSLIVIGGGPLGLEFAQLYTRFGTKVTVIQSAPRLMMRAEPELSAQLHKILTSENVDVHVGATLTEVKRFQGEKVALFSVDGREHSVRAEEILIAVGKTPNTDGLDLEAIGVKTNEKKAILVGKNFASSHAHIFAAGDVAALPLRLETTAGKEGTYAAENALTGSSKSINYDSVPWTVFTDPELAGVGLTDAEAIKRGIACNCRTVSFEHVPKAHITKDTRGLIKMVVDHKTRRILGIHILAPRAGDLIATAMMVVQNKMTIDDVIETVPMFPTLSEAIKIVAQSFDHDLSTLSCCT